MREYVPGAVPRHHPSRAPAIKYSDSGVCVLNLVKNTALGQIVHAVGATRLLQPVQARRLPRQVPEEKLLPVQVSCSCIASPSGSPHGGTPSEALFSLH